MPHIFNRLHTFALLSALIFAPLASVAQAEPSPKPAVQDAHQHDFDFEFGNWHTHIRRRVQPLTGSDKWYDLEGTSTVRKLWDGRGNLGELDVANPTLHLQGISLRLYNPETQQWSIFWANSKDGDLGRAMIGDFKNGRGEFYNQETLRGTAIFVRFIFSDITPTTFRLEQAFSADGGKTWEPNWIATFTKDKP
jgi:hypothetical protein